MKMMKLILRRDTVCWNAQRVEDVVRLNRTDLCVVLHQH